MSKKVTKSEKTEMGSEAKAFIVEEQEVRERESVDGCRRRE